MTATPPLATCERLSWWLAQTSPLEAERALLVLRDQLLRAADAAPNDCRELLDSVILPALRQAGDAFAALRIAFQFVYARLVEHGDAAFHEAIASADALNLPGLVARGWMEWAHWHQGRGAVATADYLYEQAQALFDHLELHSEAQQLYIARAQLAPRLFEWAESARQISTWLQQSLPPTVAGRLHLEAAQCWLRANQTIAADTHLRIAAQWFSNPEDAFGQRLVRTYRALWFWHLGAYGRAAELLEEVQRWFEAHQHVMEAAMAEANKASLWLASDQQVPAAIDILQRHRDRGGQTDPLLWWQLTMNLAAAYERRGNEGDFVQAARLYKELQQVEIVRAWESKLAGLNLAHLRIKAGLGEELEQDLHAALADPVVQRDPFLLFLAHENLGDCHRRAQQYGAAQACYSAALHCVEAVREQLPWEFLRRQLRQARLRVFAHLEAVLLAQQACEEAWLVADAAKGQSFTDFLQGPYPTLDKLSRRAFLLTRRKLAQAHRRAHRQRANASQGEAPADLSSATAAAADLLGRTLSECRRTYPPTPLLESWRQWPALQSDAVALVEFSRGSDGLAAYVVRAGQVCYQQLLSSDETQRLYERIRHWWRQHGPVAAAPASQTDWETETASWVRVLISGLTSHLQGVQRLLMVPDGALSLVPWAGLWDAAHAAYLGERFPAGLCLLPGARIGQFLAQRRASAEADLVLIARPDTPEHPRLLHAEVEARWLGAWFGETGQLLEGDAVTCSALRRLLHRCRWLHYAGHGVFCAEQPMASHLVLPRGQRWTGWDMLAFPLPATTVVLSACEVGSIDEAEAGEWLGLLRGFLLAGARSVIAPLWPVEDFSSLAFMQALYRSAAAAQGDLARALTLAQAEMRALSQWTSGVGRRWARRQQSWQDLLNPAVSSLRVSAQPELSQRALALLSLSLEQWRQSSPAGRLAQDEQIKSRLWKQIQHLMVLEQPQHWSVFQLYGDPGEA